MKTLKKFLRQCRLGAFGLVAVCAASGFAGAQTAAPRIMSEISNAELTPLKGSLHPRALPQYDAGRMAADTKINGATIVFSRSAAQEADLTSLIAAQQNPASPLYHQWLNPDQFAARFGMAQSDIEKVEAWLEQQGFSIDSVSGSRNAIHFSGTVRQVEQAFQTEMHYYKANGEQHFAPSTELHVPTALASTVLAVRNLNSFQPRSQVLKSSPRMRPSFTSSQSGDVFFAPGDIQTAYGVGLTLSGGYNGTGQSIAIVGQSAVTVSDIENFQKAALLTVKDPVQVLVPGTGTSTINPQGEDAGDELESDLDLEWSGAMATGATIDFVYTGSNTNYGAFDSIAYAVDEKIGNIISASYGACEPDLGSAEIVSMEQVMSQAATQGQTVVSSAGDSGSTACFVSSPVQTGDDPLSVQEEVAVNYPASSAYVTGVGGTEITAANDASGNQYWDSKGSSDIVNSLITYIPEVVWNDDTPNCGTDDCISATGGGASAYIAKPTWQTGVGGIPADGKRDVPDVAFYSSPNYPGYLYCSSDPSTDITGSCSNGFRDANDTNLTIAGGTSFAAPIFAGMVAILNQKAGYVSGQGLVNPTLYTLAANPSTYSLAFHDVTSGNNDCTAGSTYCSSSSNGFSAGTGYDQVTGLGSVNLYNLAAAWPNNSGASASLIGTTVTVVPTNATPAVNTADNFTITVTQDSGTVSPTGSITLIIDGGPSNGGPANVTAMLASNGTYIYPATFSTAGTHQIVAQYGGTSTFAASTGVGEVTISVTSSGKGTIALSASPSTLTVSQGSSGSETITVTPGNGYTGTVLLNFDTSNDSALQNLCYDFPNITSSGYGPVTISGTAAASTQLTLDTNASDCASAEVQKAKGMHRLSGVKTAKNTNSSPIPAGIAFAGLLLVGLLGRYSRKLSALAGLVAVAAIGLSLSACGGGSSSTTVSNPPKGTYTITVTGMDSVTSSITNTTTFTFVIQ